MMFLGYTHRKKMIEKGTAHVRKMDAILTDSHLDTRICIMSNVIVPKLEYAEVWEGNEKLVKQLETIQLTVAKKGAVNRRRKYDE